MVIFTTTNSNLLLPTIRSRCQIISLNSGKKDNNVDYDKLSEIIAEVYKGNIGYYYQNKSFFESYKNDNKSRIIDAYMDIFQEVINYKYGKSSLTEDVNLNIKKLENLSFDKIEEIINLLYTIKIGFKNNINYDLAMEEIIYSIYKGGK